MTWLSTIINLVQPLKCRYLLVFLEFYDINRSIFEFWTISWTKWDILRRHLKLLVDKKHIQPYKRGCIHGDASYTWGGLCTVRGESDIMQGVEPVMFHQSVESFFSLRTCRSRFDLIINPVTYTRWHLAKHGLHELEQRWQRRWSVKVAAFDMPRLAEDESAISKGDHNELKKSSFPHYLSLSLQPSLPAWLTNTWAIQSPHAVHCLTPSASSTTLQHVDIKMAWTVNIRKVLDNTSSSIVTFYILLPEQNLLEKLLLVQAWYNQTHFSNFCL